MVDYTNIYGFICFGFDIRGKDLTNFRTEPGWKVLKMNQKTGFNHLLYVKFEHIQRSIGNFSISTEDSSLHYDISITELSNLPIIDTISFNGNKGTWYLVIASGDIEVVEGESTGFQWVDSIY